jgi:hypothetical protein
MRMRKSAQSRVLALRVPALRVLAFLVPAMLIWVEHSAAAKPARGPELPEIRVSASNSVPQCVTPDRLMRYLADRNPKLDSRYRDIAALYQQHGEALGIRWDYAFFQMVLETNSLMFTGDVKAKQNNFAGLGATGGGVPGESFANVSTGVLAQLQHLVAYSGQKVEAPVAVRTRENQKDIIYKSLTLRRPVRFSDLTNRWAADRSYALSMNVLASRFHETYCTPVNQPHDQAGTWRGEIKPAAAKSETPPHKPAEKKAAAKPETPPEKKPAAAAETATLACDIWQASYGGTATLLIRSVAGAKVNYTVLQVAAGKEQPQADAYMKEHARNGETIGRFGSRDEAMTRAFELCPGPS